MNKLMKKKLNKKGFTLVELIVVIAIIAVLAIVGIPAIAGQVAKSQMATAEANAKLVSAQAQTWITEDEIAPPAAGARIAAVTNQDVVTDNPDLLAACGISPAKVASVRMTVSSQTENGTTFLRVDSVTCTVGTQAATWSRAVAP